MEARRAAGERFSIKESVGVLVPLCMQLHELHAQGKKLFIHPSDLLFSRSSGVQVAEDKAHSPPSLPRDRACLAPEERKGGEGDSRASVFACGAILYELLTGQSVGPGMRRPGDLVENLPGSLEAILGKALVADPKHRPTDLLALAQALHNIAPGASMAPPPADESRLDQGDDFEVDIRLSMIPPNEAPGAVNIPKAAALPKITSVQGDGPYAVAIAQKAAPKANDPTQRLADMKAALEADPRPRYVVVKDGMDHGPFNAVELLQQIASGSFLGEHVLRDTFSEEERFIKDWDEFAPFAEQAKLNRDIKQEKQAFEAVVQGEKQRTQYKALIGAAVIGILAAGGAGFWYRQRSNREKELTVQSDQATNVDVDGGLGSSTKTASNGGTGGPRTSPGGGSYPVLSGGMSCEAAQAKYVEEYKIGGGTGQPDLTAGAYGAVLNRGSYLNSCGVPSNMEVDVCAAVQNGRAVGVTVRTSPSNGGIASCVAGQVRALPFPSHPRLDVARTHFGTN
jgi:hypothetical protein